MKLVFETTTGLVATLEDGEVDQEYGGGVEVSKISESSDPESIAIEFQGVAIAYLSLEEARQMAAALVALCKDEPVKIS